MARVWKCDNCGSNYEDDNYEYGKGAFINNSTKSIQLAVHNPDGRKIILGSMDLCPECYLKLQKFLKIKNFSGKVIDEDKL